MMRDLMNNHNGSQRIDKKKKKLIIINDVIKLYNTETITFVSYSSLQTILLRTCLSEINNPCWKSTYKFVNNL